MIRNIALLPLASASLGACATKGYVRNQVETGVAAERSAREAADTDINGKVTTLGTDLSAVKSEVATLQTDVAALRRDLTAPVPLIGTPAVERVAHAIARLRPWLFAYQLIVAATPA